MIYYPLSTLMLAGIREILIITMRMINQTLKDYLEWRATRYKYKYAIQKKPEGLAQAFIVNHS